MSLLSVDAQLAAGKQRRTAAWLVKMESHILSTNGANFINARDETQGLWRHRIHQTPMLLTAWTQTTSDDFELLHTLQQDPQLQAENRALREKVRYLETKLQEHTDLLSQIHATSARMQSVATPTPPPPQPQMLTPPSSVICGTSLPPPTQHLQQQQQQQQQSSEVVDYKIVSAADDADSIEIRLAAESLNSLSSSADSERLEICLNDEVKRECGTPVHLIKRRKLEAATPTLTPTQHYKLPKQKIKIQTQSNGQLTENVMVSIGPNNTCVPATVFENINWSVSSLATRKLLVSIFDRETLATHSMTGKPSPAFKDQHKPLKQMLDPLKIQDIIFAVTRKSNASEKEVRNAITTKCADENKMMKIQNGKRCSISDKENMI